MKQLILYIALGAIVCCTAVACGDDDQQTTWDEYTTWREQNDAWVAEMAARRNPDGTPYYEKIIPAYNPGATVLIHYFNDRAETAGKLSPLYTSVVDVRYVGRDCTGAGFDSSTLATEYGPGIQRFSVNGTIQGWGIALQEMRVGDTCEIIVPYGLAYGAASSTAIKPYSALQFNIRLSNIYRYEAAQ